MTEHLADDAVVAGRLGRGEQVGIERAGETAAAAGRRRDFRATGIGAGAEAFLIALDQGAAYGSPNFLWFRDRFTSQTTRSWPAASAAANRSA
jgi:hypothetical protein